MHDKSLFPFHDLIWQVSLGVMKVDGLDIDVGVESVLIEENRAACMMGHVEPTCKNVMIDIGLQSAFQRRLLFRVWAQGSSCRC